MKRLLTLESRDMVLIAAAAMFMAQLDAAVLAIALPGIARDFGLPTLSLSLAVTVYLTMLVAVLPVSGWAADRFGPKRVFLAATASFALFSLGCALSESFWPFILARALQGASAALLASVGRLILLRQTRKSELVDALAITAMPMLVAPTLGPSLGGFIIEYGRWEYIFLLNLPISALIFLAGAKRIADASADPAMRLDWVGAGLLSGGLVAALTGFDRLVGGLAAPLPWMLIGGGVALLWAAVRHMGRHPAPLIRFDAMASRAFRTAVLGAGAIVRVPGRALLFALPLLFQLGFGLAPFAAGLLLMALNGGDLVTKPWIGPLFGRFGYRNAVFFGSLAGLAAFAVFVLARPGPALVPLLAAALVIAGISRSLVYTGMASLSYAVLDKSTMTSGNVLSSISMQVFNTLAISSTAVLLSLFAAMNGHAEPEIADYRYTLAAIAVVGLTATLLLRRQLPRDLREVHSADDV